MSETNKFFKVQLGPGHGSRGKVEFPKHPPFPRLSEEHRKEVVHFLLSNPIDSPRELEITALKYLDIRVPSFDAEELFAKKRNGKLREVGEEEPKPENP